MKTIVLFAILGIVSTAPQHDDDPVIQVRGLIEDGINKTLNGILANLSDPITVDSLSLNLEDQDTLKGGLNVTTLNINGVKTLVASEISLNIFTLALDLKLHISELLVNFKYGADLLLLELVPLYGDGRINVVLEDLDLSISGSANVTDGLTLKNITVGITLGDATFDLNGLINNPEFSALVSVALNDNFVPFIDQNAEVISKIISPIVEEILDSLLNSSNSTDTFQDVELQRQLIANKY